VQADFKITFVGGESFTVTTGPADFVRAERHTGQPITSGEPTFEALCFIAYSAAKRAGKAGSDFDAWLDDVASIEDTADAEGNEPAAA
jgi:hypothetical protein